jgi:hypothetical protein
MTTTVVSGDDLDFHHLDYQGFILKLFDTVVLWSVNHRKNAVR